jgi:hypothetical protein
MEPLPSNDTGIHIQMGGLYEVRRWDGMSCHDIHTKFNKDWIGHSEVNREDTQLYRQHGDRISLLLFSKNNESRLKDVGSRRLIPLSIKIE